MAKTALLLAAAALALWVFWEPIVVGRTLVSADNPPYYETDFGKRIAEGFTGWWREEMLGVNLGVFALHPTRILGVLVPPLTYRVLSYLLDIGLMMLAVLYLLRCRGVRGLAAFIPALAFAFSGHAFTLISAGHLMKFDMLPYAVFMVGLVDRAVGRRSAFHFAAAGLCAGFAIVSSPDIAGLFGLLTIVYALFRLARTWDRSAWKRDGVRWVLGGVIGAVIFSAVAASGIAKLRQIHLPHRSTLQGTTPQEKWEYCTSWSMPPEDILEFVAPCVYGVETSHSTAPYWGRLGRSWGWEETGQGFHSFRQHSVYLGVLQLLFAAYAMVWLFKRCHAVAAPDAAIGTVSERERRWDIAFWTSAFAVCVMLSLGRYFPLYRVFYAVVPFAARIRCPVKFLHLVELSLCCLFAFGLDRFFADLRNGGKGPDGGGRRKVLAGFAIAAAAIAVLLFAGTLVVDIQRPALSAYWQQLGLASHTAELLSNMKGALARGGLLFLAGAGVFGLGLLAERLRNASVVAAWAVLIVVFLDLGTVARRYINCSDLSAFFAPNPIAERIHAGGELSRTSYYLSRRTSTDPLWVNFWHHSVDVLELRQDRGIPLSEEYRNFFSAVGANTLRMWQLTNTRFIVGPVQRFKELINRPDFEAVQYFTTKNSRLVEAPDGQGPIVLLEYRDAIPRAVVYHTWEDLPPEEILPQLVDPTWNPARSVLLSNGPPARSSDLPPTAVKYLEYGRKRIVIETDAVEEGMLVLNDKHDPGWKVRVDGKPAALLRANYIMRGVRLSAGHHIVEFTFYPYLLPFAASVAASGAVFAWFVIRLVRGRRAKS